MKESFLLYLSQHEAIRNELSLEEKGILLDAICDYNFKEIIPDMPPSVKVAFNFMRSQFDRDIQKYEAICLRNRENGARGGRPSKEKEEETEKPKKPSGLLGNPEKPKKPDTDSDTDSDSDKDNGEVSKIQKLSKIQKEFYDSLAPFISEFSKETLRAFYNYWSEPNKSKTRIRWQLEKTWDTKKRLIRWDSKSFKKPEPVLTSNEPYKPEKW